MRNLLHLGQLRYQREKSAHYRAVLGNPAAERVLADLSEFCLRNLAPTPRSKVTGMIDPTAMAIGIGRREVWDRIQGFLNLDERQLARMEQQERERRELAAGDV